MPRAWTAGGCCAVLLAALLVPVAVLIPGGGVGASPGWIRLSVPWSPPGWAGSGDLLFAYDAADGYPLLVRDWDTLSFGNGAWTNVSTPSTPGTPRSPDLGQGGMAYDAADGYVLYQSGSGSAHGDTVSMGTIKYAAGNWTRVDTGFFAPPVCWELMAYDAADGYVVLFGGSDNPMGGHDLNGTWTYVGGTWTELNLTVAPPTSSSHGAMVYDAADGYVLLFGGSTCVGANCTFTNETWAFSGGRWTQLHPAVAPSARVGAAMAYDAAEGYVLLFGGTGELNPYLLADTWTYRGGQWTQLTLDSSPSPRSLAAMTYDPGNNRTMMVGGLSGSTRLQETWVYGVPASNGGGGGETIGGGGGAPVELLATGIAAAIILVVVAGVAWTRIRGRRRSPPEPRQDPPT